MTRIYPFLFVSLLLVSPGCDDGGGKSEGAKAAKSEAKGAEKPAKEDAKAPDTKAGDSKAETPSVKEHMGEHFAAAETLRNALVRGDLDAVAEPAKWLAEHETYESMPDEWQAHVQDMQNAGQLILDGTDLAAKAKAA